MALMKNELYIRSNVTLAYIEQGYTGVTLFQSMTSAYMWEL